MKVSFITFGCKVNQYDTQSMQEQFAAGGFEIAEEQECCDVYIINSCTVTATGDKKTRQAIGRCRRLAPESLIVLTGCFAQAYPERTKELDADFAIGSKNHALVFSKVCEALTKRSKNFAIPSFSPHDTFTGSIVSRSGEKRTRAFIKIEDGCDRFCSYCIIPYSRGGIRSKPPEELKTELESLAQQEYAEIVFVGINLCAYGREWGGSLLDAVKLAEAYQFPRIRLGSLEPDLVAEPLIEGLRKSPSVCPHFHLSLQSGCDETLKRMNRRYTTREYAEKVALLRTAFSDVSITTDVMLGFPGENEAEFNETKTFMKEVAFSSAHIFPFSRRPGTPADRMGNQVSAYIKKKRCAEIAEITAKSRQEFFRRFLGKTVSVVFDHTVKGPMLEGVSANYLPVRTPAKYQLQGRLNHVIIKRCTSDFCYGEPV